MLLGPIPSRAKNKLIEKKRKFTTGSKERKHIKNEQNKAQNPAARTRSKLSKYLSHIYKKKEFYLDVRRGTYISNI